MDVKKVLLKFTLSFTSNGQLGQLGQLREKEVNTKVFY